MVIRLLCIKNKFLTFKTYTIWFSEAPFEVDGVAGVTFMSCPCKVDLPGFSRREHSTIVLDLKRPLDTLWNELGKTNRQRIKKAERTGVQISIDKDQEEFIRMNDRFRRIKGLPSHTVSPEYMKAYGTLFTAVLDSELLAGCFNLVDDLNMRGLIGATIRLEVEPERQSLVGNANRMLEWEMIKYAKERSMDTYDIGGYYTGEHPDQEKSNINEFKRSFGGALVSRYDYQKDYSPLLKGARLVKNSLDKGLAGERPLDV
mgnify:CR=1 FL=1